MDTLGYGEKSTIATIQKARPCRHHRTSLGSNRTKSSKLDDWNVFEPDDMRASSAADSGTLRAGHASVAARGRMPRVRLHCGRSRPRLVVGRQP